MHRHFLFLFVLSALLSSSISGEELPRRAHVGIGIADAPGGRGAVLAQVVPNGPTAESGFLAGDVILQVGDLVINSSHDLREAVRTRTNGGALPTRLLRNGEEMSLTWNMKELPREEHPGLETVYTSMDVVDRRHRAIIVKPTGKGPFPAVLLVTGIACGTVDVIAPANSPHPLYRLPDQLAHAGFIVLKVEKSGIGDSIGAPCSSVGLKTDIETWRAAFALLGTLPYVDPDARFILGEGFGGTIAPHVLGDETARGIVTYGAWYGDFMEWSLAGTRRAATMQGKPPAEMTADLRAEAEFLARLLYRRENIGDIVRSNPSIAAFTGKYSQSEEHFMTRSSSYYHDVAELDLTEPWESIACDVLVLWGSSDLFTDRSFSESLVSLRNHVRDGSATFVEVTGANHHFMKTSQGAPAGQGQAPEFHLGPGEAAIAWMKDRL